MDYARFTLLFTLDWGTFFREGGMSYSNYAHSLVIVGLPLLMLLIHHVLLQTVQPEEGKDMSEKHEVRLALDKTFLFIAEFIYIPVLIVALRMFSCTSVGLEIDTDSECGLPSFSLLTCRWWSAACAVACWGVHHILLVIITTPISFGFIISLPVLLIYRTYKIAVFHDSTMHERYAREGLVVCMLA
jgi:hypothetical protein